jgi:hypothetical protein
MSVVTERDRRMLFQLAEAGVLSTQQIHRLFFSGVRKTTFLRRMRALEASNYIRRVEGLSQGRLAWVLTLDGARCIGSALPLKSVNRNSIEHDVILSEIRLALEQNQICTEWVAEHTLKARQTKKRGFTEPVVPDGIFSTNYNNRSVSVAIELELHRKAKHRYSKILRRYAQMNSLFAVWYVVPSHSLGKLIHSIYSNINIYREKKTAFVWSLSHEVVDDCRNARLLQVDPPLTLSKVFRLPQSAHAGAHAVSGTK